MPIKIDASLPARSILESEHIFVMTQERAKHQDIRPLRIVILNLMPTKIVTETQLLRLLSNSPLQVDVSLLQMASHRSQNKNTSEQHLLEFYQTLPEIQRERFDGMIITGAPVEQLPFEDVDYWPELCEIFAWSRSHVWSTFHICWGAQAGLYHHHGIQKYPLPKKCSGVYAHTLTDPTHPIVRGFDEVFYAPHSRGTEVRAEEILAHPELKLVAVSEEAGVHLVSDRKMRNIYVAGHAEYDRETLAYEYERDCLRAQNHEIVHMPEHYFPGNDVHRAPVLSWRGAASLLFSNWLNEFVYQSTPFDWS